MSTPAFVSTASTYTSVRYYSPFDPYFYTIDNRPLTDLATNDTDTAIGADSARRAELIHAVGRSVTLQQQFGTAAYTTGLLVTNPASNQITIGYGALHQALALSASDSAVVVKQAILRRPQTLNIPAPGGGGQNQYYLVEGQYVDFGGSTSSDFPFWDSTNALLPSSILDGELQLKITAGVAAAAGSEAPPAATGGNWFPLYLFDVSFGTNIYTVQQPYTPLFAYGAPNCPGYYAYHRSTGLTTLGSASTAAVGDTPSVTLIKGGNSGALISIPLLDNTSGIAQTNLNNINPYKPLRFKITYSAATAGANTFGIRAKYQSYASGENVSTVSYTATATEAVTAAGTSNFALSYTTGSLAVIPASALQAAITANKLYMNVVLERLVADGNDTNAATMNLYNVTLFQ